MRRSGLRLAWGIVAAGLFLATSTPAQSVDNPYANVNWNSVEYLHSVSHLHSEWSDVDRLWGIGLRHFPISNYPSGSERWTGWG